MKAETLNRNRDEITGMYDSLRDSIRNYVSRVLADNNATEDNPLEINTALEFGAMGLSTLEMPHVESIFQDDDGSGMIWMNTDWNGEPVDFDELYIDDQIDIVMNL